jgi:hypothetical protein
MRSKWFRRLEADCKLMSPHIRFKQIKHGFYRIYYKSAYIGECYGMMPEHGYDIYEKALGFEDYSYYQKYHDTADSTLKIKNFVEGYWETFNKIRTRLFMFRHNREAYDRARQGYSQLRIK